MPFCPTKLFSERLQSSLKSGLISTIISLKPRLYHVIHLKEWFFSVNNRSSNSPFELQFLETTQKQVFWLAIFFFFWNHSTIFISHSINWDKVESWLLFPCSPMWKPGTCGWSISFQRPILSFASTFNTEKKSVQWIWQLLFKFFK